MSKDIKSNFSGLKGSHIVIEQKISDWDGEDLFKSRTAASDRKNTYKAFKTIIDKAGLPFKLKREDKNHKDTKNKIKKSIEEDKEKIKKYLSE